MSKAVIALSEAIQALKSLEEKPVKDDFVLKAIKNKKDAITILTTKYKDCKAVMEHFNGNIEVVATDDIMPPIGSDIKQGKHDAVVSGWYVKVVQRKTDGSLSKQKNYVKIKGE